MHVPMSERQNIYTDSSDIVYRQYQQDNYGTHSVVWQQQMDKSPIKTFRTTHHDRPDPHIPIDYCNDFETHLRPYQLNKDYNRLYTDPECGKWWPFTKQKALHAEN